MMTIESKTTSGRAGTQVALEEADGSTVHQTFSNTISLVIRVGLRWSEEKTDLAEGYQDTFVGAAF